MGNEYECTRDPFPTGFVQVQVLLLGPKIPAGMSTGDPRVDSCHALSNVYTSKKHYKLTFPVQTQRKIGLWCLSPSRYKSVHI